MAATTAAAAAEPGTPAPAGCPEKPPDLQVGAIMEIVTDYELKIRAASNFKARTERSVLAFFQYYSTALGL